MVKVEIHTSTSQLKLVLTLNPIKSTHSSFYFCGSRLPVTFILSQFSITFQTSYLLSLNNLTTHHPPLDFSILTTNLLPHKLQLQYLPNVNDHYYSRSYIGLFYLPTPFHLLFDKLLSPIYSPVLPVDTRITLALDTVLNIFSHTFNCPRLQKFLTFPHQTTSDD